MRSRLVINAVDSHTEGMPTRVVTSGVGELPGGTMDARRLYLMNERDDLRTLLMYEPRGHSAMSGSILQQPTRPDADFGVVFIEVSGCLPMCSHGTMGTALHRPISENARQAQMTVLAIMRGQLPSSDVVLTRSPGQARRYFSRLPSSP